MVNCFLKSLPMLRLSIIHTCGRWWVPCEACEAMDERPPAQSFAFTAEVLLSDELPLRLLRLSSLEDADLVTLVADVEKNAKGPQVADKVIYAPPVPIRLPALVPGPRACLLPRGVRGRAIGAPCGWEGTASVPCVHASELLACVWTPADPVRPVPAAAAPPPLPPQSPATPVIAPLTTRSAPASFRDVSLCLGARCHLLALWAVKGPPGRAHQGRLCCV